MGKVKERRLSKPRHIQTLMQEQINLLRGDEKLDPIQKARAIAYLATVALTAMKDGDLEERIGALEKSMTERDQRGTRR